MACAPLPRPRAAKQSYPGLQQLRRRKLAASAACASGAATALALVAALAGFTVIALTLLPVAVAMGLHAHHHARLAGRAGVGARSEADVRRALVELEGEGWRLHHSLPWQRGDIDHVAVAPTGIGFAIETKTRRYEARHLHTARAQAAWLQRRRPRWCPQGALPVLCVSHARHIQTSELDVLVVSLDGLLPALRVAAGTIGRPGFLAPPTRAARG